MNARRPSIVLLCAALSLSLLACQIDLGQVGIGGSSAPPSVQILSPPTGTTVTEGDSVAIQISAQHTQPLREIRLLVDGNPVAASGSPQGRTSIQTTMNWRASGPGGHTLSVVATDQAGAESPLATVTVIVEPKAPPPTSTREVPPEEPEPEPEREPESEPSTEPPPPPAPEGCEDAMTFVADVTVPDGSEMSSGLIFEKVWRISNAGDCVWEGYQLAYESGAKMPTEGTVPIPSTPPGETVDIAVEMVAPDEPGEYTARWVVENADGATLSGLTIAIVVTESKARSDSGPPGAPVIDRFDADSTGTPGCFKLIWELHDAKEAHLITNPGTSVEGVQAIVGDDSQVVCPEGDTVYRVEAVNDKGTAWKEVVLP